jgi:Fe-S-cluster containining protein
MDSGYFTCNPETLCEGAKCCKSIDTHPALTLGDFYRLSKIAEKPMEDIWKAVGDISLMQHPSLPNNLFAISLGMLHDPCPYLSPTYKCDVYDSRPLGCAGFPIIPYLSDKNNLLDKYSSYTCLQNLKPSPRQIRLGRELEQIMREETLLDKELFWHGQFKYMKIDTLADCLPLLKKAYESQMKRDPKNESFRTIRLARYLQEFDEQLTAFNRQGDHFTIECDKLCSLMSPLILAITEDSIAERVVELKNTISKAYDKSTKKYEILVKKMGI